jgi:hypothetical protein
MKIQKVKIRDFKVIKNLETEVNGNNILLIGDNGVGKSSFIQFIEIALGRQVDLPVLDSGNGYVEVDKDGQEWRFDVVFKKGKPVITVTSPDGFKDDRKSVLAKVVGAMDFDIDQFVAMSDSKAGQKKQVEIFLSLLPKEVQDFIADQNYRVKRSFDERTEKNREIKTLEGFLSEHPYTKVVDPLPESKIDTIELTVKIETALESNKKRAEIKSRYDARLNELSDIEFQIKALQDKAKMLQQSQDKANEWLSDPANAEVDLTDLMTQKDNAYAINSMFAMKDDYEKNSKQLKALREEVGDMTVFVETSRQAIADAIKDCDSPVEGLTFDDETLIYNDVPVTAANLSSSEIMHLGIKLKMAENPDLGVLFIQRGESLGSARLKEIQELAKANNWQIIMEQVERGNERLTIEVMEG